MTPEQIEKWRAQFESWIKSPPYERRAIRFGESSAWPGSYASIDIDLAWQAWQECARLVAQDTWERAAKIPERRRDARFEEHGTTEHDTNASYYTGRAAEMYDALDEEDFLDFEEPYRLGR